MSSEIDLTADFRTITELAAPREPWLPPHCRRCENDLYYVRCGAEDHLRCFACTMCVEPDWMLGQIPLQHTATGSRSAWYLSADWPGDAPPGGISPGVVPSPAEATANIAAGIESVIEDRLGGWIDGEEQL